MVQNLMWRGAVEAATGYRRSSLCELIKKGRFPKPIKLDADGRSVAWIESEVEAWQAARIAARDAQAV